MLAVAVNPIHMFSCVAHIRNLSPPLSRCKSCAHLPLIFFVPTGSTEWKRLCSLFNHDLELKKLTQLDKRYILAVVMWSSKLRRVHHTLWANDFLSLTLRLFSVYDKSLFVSHWIRKLSVSFSSVFIY